MKNQELRELAQELVDDLQQVIPEDGRRAAVSKEISSALAHSDIEVLQKALGRDDDVRTWVHERIGSTDRAVGLDGDATSASEVIFVCAKGHNAVLDNVPLESPVCFCGLLMSPAEG